MSLESTVIADSFSSSKDSEMKNPLEELINNQEQFGNGQNENPRIVTRYILLEKPTTLADVVPFAVIFFIYGLIIQTVLIAWKKVHKKSHDLFLLFLVVFFPPILLFFLSDRIFILFWIIFVLFISNCFNRTLIRPIHKETPRELYSTFKHIFCISYSCIAIGQSLTIGTFLFYVPGLILSLRILLYSVYFAVLAREVAMNLSLLMASKTGFFSKEGIPGLVDSNRICMICTGDLDKDSGISTLVCGHSYHNGCIKGWFMVGQNGFCPYCKKGIDKSLFKCDLWDKAELSFRPLMNFIRSFISFFIITFSYILLKSRSQQNSI